MACGPATPRRAAESTRRCCWVPGEVLWATCRLLRQNPQLCKVTLAAGLQMAAADIASAFDMGPDVYNERHGQGGGAAWVAGFRLAESCVALLTAPAFGRFTDLVDRRIAYLVLGLFSCMPTWVYWFVDLNTDKAMLANHIATIFAATGTTSHVAFALSMDVSPFEDRELAAGAFFGLKHFIAMLLAPLPCLIFINSNAAGLKEFILDHPHVCLFYQLVLTVLFVIWVFQVKPEKQGCEDEAMVSNTQTDSSDSQDCACTDMMRLMCTDPRLKRLCLAGFVLSFCRAAALGVSGQYYYQALDLHKSGEYVEVNVLRNFSSYLGALPGALFAGYVAMKTGTLKTLRRIIPVTGLLLSVGVALKLVDAIWFTIVIQFLLGTTHLYMVPLQRLVAGVARPGATGFWLNMLGVANCFGQVAGDLVIVCTNLSYWHFERTSMPLWPYYPVAGLVALLALLPLLPDKPGPATGWGVAAGLPQDVLATTIGVARFAAIWKNKTIRKSAGTRKQKEREDDSSAEETVLEGIARRLGFPRRRFSRRFTFAGHTRRPGSSSSEDCEPNFLVTVGRRLFSRRELPKAGSSSSSGKASSGGSAESASEVSEDEESEDLEDGDASAEEVTRKATASKTWPLSSSAVIKSVEDLIPRQTAEERVHENSLAHRASI